MNKDEISSAVASFLDYIKNKSISDHTPVNYAVDIRQFAEFLEEQGISGLSDVDVSKLRAYLRSLFGWGYSKATLARKLSALRGFFSFLKARGIVERDPAHALRGPSAPRGIPRALSMEAMDRLFCAASEGEHPIRDSAILEVLYGCALRVSELVSLQWRDVDLEERWLVVLGKGGKERRLPFGSCAQRALVELRDAAGENVGTFVFSGRKGKALTVRTVHRVIVGLASRVGLEGVAPHVLRHSCATHFLENGASLRFVQEFLGHETMATTQIYLSVSALLMKESYLAHHPRAAISEVSEAESESE